ncbi:DUF2167 domain-containing protein [Dyella mobilis]|uniref:DUF2167 domain-containing protein n=1 Tax=Dyella mobilis TaxID=1849582 RepID=A0ABS2KE73_9GAMM|nr:DUF2167 domain-containing protein [Dyella mobilis]MBM7128648.1 DUF2167 domain-containing protein [Dyella mobilis]GLQ99447.1 membrane protein [Dyella mobilis]
MKKFFLVLVALLLACAAQTLFAQEQPQQGQRNPLASLPWEMGPATVKLGNQASLNVPDGYAFLGPAGSRSLNEILHNPPANVDVYTLAPKSLAWIAFFSYEDIGYVKDDEKLDPDAILQSYREGTEKGNEERRARGWSELNVLGWKAKPEYDTQIKSLAWSILLQDQKTQTDVVNYNTRLLGRHGVMDVVMVTEPSRLATSIDDFKSTLPGFQYAQGESYAEYRAGDRVAEYGLAALITGGALAVAAKKGLFTVIGGFLVAAWKFVVAGIVALGAWFKNLVKKKPAR